MSGCSFLPDRWPAGARERESVTSIGSEGLYEVPSPLGKSSFQIAGDPVIGQDREPSNRGIRLRRSSRRYRIPGVRAGRILFEPPGVELAIAGVMGQWGVGDEVFLRGKPPTKVTWPKRKRPNLSEPSRFPSLFPGPGSCRLSRGKVRKGTS